jgi:hypothetical protein
MFEFVSIEKLPNTSSKKFKVILKNKKTNRGKTIQFGAKGYENYTSGHLDEERRNNYIARHSKREDWTKSGVDTAGFWSYHYLWKYKTFKEALEKIKSMYF